jgi:superfamily II DNA helicase RecQ
MDALRLVDGQATGKLSRDTLGETQEDRREFETLLGGLVRAGALTVEQDSFERDGRKVTFQRAHLAEAFLRRGAALLSEVRLLEEAKLLPRTKSRKPRRLAKRARVERSVGRAPGRRHPQKSFPREEEPSGRVQVDGALVARLREWRLHEARRHKVPAFRILSNRTLESLASERPRDRAALCEVKGIGPKTADRYADTLLALLR